MYYVFNKSIYIFMQNCCVKKRKCFKSFLIIIIIFTVIFLYFNLFVNPQIVSGNTSKIKAETISLINSATATTISNNDYDDIISVSKDSNGNVTLLQVNSKNINKLNSDVLLDIQTNLNAEKNIEYYLPFGAFTGIPALSNIGPNIKLKIVPIGNVNTHYTSQIASLSINQSYHKIYLTISVNVCMIFPLYTRNIEVSNQILIAESIIVGQIPTTYLNTENLTNALNLIPD